MGSSIRLSYQVARRFNGMAGCMQHFQGAAAQGEKFAILRQMDRKIRFGLGAIYDGGPGGFGKVQVPAYKVGMKMGLENISDRCLSLLCQLEICLDITQWINNGGFSVAFDIIGGFAQAPGIQLLNKHNPSISCK